MSPAFWDWKYRQSGGLGIGVWEGERLVAHYGGTGTTAVFEGAEVSTVQVCDVMVDPAVRHAVRRQSPYFLSTSGFLEHCVGSGKRFLLAYGFPSDRHLHLGMHLGLYAEVGTMSELHFDNVAVGATDWLYRWQPLEAANAAEWLPQAERLWQAMRQSLPQTVLVCKDTARLRYRYLQHPDNRYHLWLLKHRLTGRALALVVLKEEDERILLMDVIGTYAELDQVLRLTSLAVRKRWQRPMVFWLSTVYAERIALGGVTCNRLPISTPANIWTDSPAPERLRNRWWLTAGDTDSL
jgi:hypothetical protein